MTLQIENLYFQQLCVRQIKILVFASKFYCLISENRTPSLMGLLISFAAVSRKWIGPFFCHWTMESLQWAFSDFVVALKSMPAGLSISRHAKLYRIFPSVAHCNSHDSEKKLSLGQQIDKRTVSVGNCQLIRFWIFFQEWNHFNVLCYRLRRQFNTWLRTEDIYLHQAVIYRFQGWRKS